MSPGPGHPDLADFLARHREAIVSEWTEGILRIPNSQYQESAAEDLRSLTTRSINSLIQYFTTDDFDAVEQHLQELVEVRASHGFEIAEVITAFFLVRDVVITRILHEGSGGCWDQTDRLIEFDAALCKTITRFAALFATRTHDRLRAAALVEERQRLARELHDSVTQLVYGVTLYAEAGGRLLERGEIEQAKMQLDRIRNYSMAALAELRMLIFELHPPVIEKIGFVRAVQVRLSSVEARSGIKTTFRTDTEERFPLRIEVGLMRITQEALNNILKHSHAQRVDVSLRTGGNEIVLEIHDDGIGFKVDASDGKGGHGLIGMYERARELLGSLEVESETGKGARVRITLPHPRMRRSNDREKEGKSRDAETDSNPDR